MTTIIEGHPRLLQFHPVSEQGWVIMLTWKEGQPMGVMLAPIIGWATYIVPPQPGDNRLPTLTVQPIGADGVCTIYQHPDLGPQVAEEDIDDSTDYVGTIPWRAPSIVDVALATVREYIQRYELQPDLGEDPDTYHLRLEGRWCGPVLRVANQHGDAAFEDLRDDTRARERATA